ncbi:MAG: hypothetical protein ACP5I1_16570, partial [Candidatus Hinthialibacter sp.]
MVRAKSDSVSGNLQISVGALEGDLSSGASVDGSINFSTKMSSSEFLDEEGYIYAIINTKKTQITPFIQITRPEEEETGEDGETAESDVQYLYIDRLDVIDGSMLSNVMPTVM